jgi:F-type H+-transporting ATPase subunit epsilon
MSQNLTLEVVTPEKVLLETSADYVTIPGSIGELGILAGHLPLLTSLKSGVLSYKSDGEQKKYAIHYGFAEVCKDKITILANEAEVGADIDLSQAQADQKSAEVALDKAVKESLDNEVIERLQKSIAISVTRQEAVK